MIEIKRNNRVFFTLEDVCDGSKLSRQLMDHHYIILKFSSDMPVHFEVGDSVEIPDFGYFELTSAYFPKYNNSTGGYDYEMQMDAYYMAWKNKLCKFRPQHGANETSFKLTTKVSGHLSVILSNLKALGLTYNGKDFSVDYTTYNKEVFDTEKHFYIEYSSISILEALNAICESLDCEWWVDGSIIYLGYCELSGQTTFEHGVNMLSMSQSASKSSFITRLYAFGSDKNIPTGYFTGPDADATTDGIATDYLMLPTKGVDKDGFFCKNGYMENANVVKNDKQAIEGIVIFSDEYPKVECTVSNIKTYDSTVEENGEKVTETFWQVTSSDRFATSFSASWIKRNLTLMIKFTSGSLMGMEFEASFKVIEQDNYFEIVANDTYGRKLPDPALCPKVGDKFFIYNWDATKITETDLIQEAQESLFERAKTYYKKSMIDNSNFTCELDGEKFYNHGIYDYHPIGEQVKLIDPMFSDTDANGKHYRNSRIIGMEIKLDIPYDSPQYIVGEKAAYSRLGQLEEKVDSITVNGIKIGSAGSGGGVYVIGTNDSTPVTDSNVFSARRSRQEFLSKKYDDVANGHVTFQKGITSNGDIEVNADLHASGDLSTNSNLHVNQSAEIDQDINVRGNATIGGDLNVKGNTSLKDLTVTGSAHFFELVIDKIKAAGGTYIFSAANSFNVERVAVGSDVVRLYWLAEANGNGSMNTWEVGDQAISMDFNRAKVGSTFSASNKYWWALVTATSGNTPETITEDGADHLYHWIEVSTIEKAEGCTVEADLGDAVAQLGSRGADKKRQAAQMIAAYKSPDTGVEAPCWVQYVGINSFTITEDNRLNRVAYNGNVFKGSFVAMSEGEQGRDLLEWLESLQHDTDAHFDIWYGEGAPTLENEPAVEWGTDNQKAAHVDDLYFDRSDTAKSDGGHCYRFVATTKDGTTAYSWEDYTDHDTLKALTKAQSIADDGIITAGTEKAQLLITRKNMEAEHSSFSAPTDPSSTYGTAYNLYTKAYNAFMTATADIVSEANIGKDTSLEDIGLTASGYTELYYNYYTSLAKVREASEASIKASISTIGGKVNLAVTKDGLKTAGMTVEDEHISLDAKKTTVRGDLTVQGALTNSTSYVSTDGSLWSPNDVGELEKQPDNLLTAGGSLFVPINMTSIKSVQIQTSDPSLVSDGSPTSASTALVTLPMYAAADLGCGVTVPAYRRSGTHVLIRNGFSLAYNQWSKSDGWTDAALRRNIEAAAVYVCSDPRALALSNYTASYPTVAPDGRDANGKFATADWFKGCMYLNGRRGRWLALLPGQQVELVSVITMWQTGSNTPVPYLGWYVVGGEGMDWLEKTISFEPPSASHNRYDAIFRSGVTGGEHFGVGSVDKFADAFFGYGQLSDTETLTETIVVTLSEDDKPSISIG
nr:MAG TPA: tail protein [Caudoviricetes sp.]